MRFINVFCEFCVEPQPSPTFKLTPHSNNPPYKDIKLFNNPITRSQFLCGDSLTMVVNFIQFKWAKYVFYVCLMWHRHSQKYQRRHKIDIISGGGGHIYAFVFTDLKNSQVKNK